MSTLDNETKESWKKRLEDMFNIPLLNDYNTRFNFLGDELDGVKMGLFNVQELSKNL